MIIMVEFDYKKEIKIFLERLDKSEWSKVLSYEFCEIGEDFPAFLHSYKDLAEILPENMTIIDIGAYQGVQGEYFRNFEKYIAVEPFIPKEYMYSMPNSIVYTMTGESFISDLLPELQQQGLDLNKTFCVCSYVPDEILRNELIPKTFPYYRTTYAGCETHQIMPSLFKEKKRIDIER